MSKAKFEKIGKSDKILYGPRKLLLCGFSAGAQSKFQTVLKMVGLNSVPKIWVGADQAEQSLAEILTLEDDTGVGSSSALPRAIIVAGISENELTQLMTVCRKSGMSNALWAALTPVSQQWTIAQLLAELAAERKEMQKRR